MFALGAILKFPTSSKDPQSAVLQKAVHLSTRNNQVSLHRQFDIYNLLNLIIVFTVHLADKIYFTEHLADKIYIKSFT